MKDCSLIFFIVCPNGVYMCISRWESQKSPSTNQVSFIKSHQIPSNPIKSHLNHYLNPHLSCLTPRLFSNFYGPKFFAPCRGAREAVATDEARRHAVARLEIAHQGPRWSAAMVSTM